VAAAAAGASAVAASRWKPADPAYRLSLPRDHASHPEHRLEWWYYTGNLATRGGRRVGYQLTFFRVGIDPAPVNPSRWAVGDLYMAHFAVTDVEAGRHRSADRLNRAGIAWAGAATGSYRVWNEDWIATLDGQGRHVLRARAAGVKIDLRLEPGKPFVAHGASGYSRKGAEPGNASHYYSLTRMPTRGTVAIDGVELDVAGTSWMDHEFGTSFLETGQLGWDWFSVQLDDGTDLMLFQMRRADGRRDPHSSGTIVDAAGRAQALRAEDFTLVAGEPWRSPKSGARYPISWSIAIPGGGLEMDVRAALPDQELRTERSTGVTYWEGAIDVRGRYRGRVVTGLGYLEMTGYVGRAMSDVMR
jgi:predicted secreted hydrolase